MALYIDGDPVLSPNDWVLSQIANFDGQFGFTPATIAGVNCWKVTLVTDPPPGFGYSRLQAIANTQSPVLLSAVSGNYTLPNGTLIANVQAAEEFGLFVFWDRTDCNGSGYHVFDTFGYPIPNPPFLAVFQELSYVYHAAGGLTNGALDALVKAETNILRGELGLRLRSPANPSGGCGPGSPPWVQIIKDIVAAVEGFLEVYAGSMPRLQPEMVAASLRDALSDSGHLVTRALSDSPLLRNTLDVVLLGALRSYYDTAALILDKRSVSDDLPQRLGHLIETLRKKMPESGTIDILLNTSQDPNNNVDILSVFIGDPYKIMRRARTQLVTGRPITEVSDQLRDSVTVWGTRVSQWKPQTADRESTSFAASSAGIAEMVKAATTQGQADQPRER